MAADAGLIKSASQAYKNNEVDYKLGENIQYGLGKISEGISKAGDIKRAQKEKDDLKREKQAAAGKLAIDKFEQNVSLASGAAKTKKQQEVILGQAKSWRNSSKGYFNTMNTFGVDTPEYAEAQDGLLKIRTSMQNTVSSFNDLNASMEERATLELSGNYSRANDDDTLQKTNGFLEETYNSKIDENGFYVIESGVDVDGNPMYVNTDKYNSSLARVKDPSIGTSFKSITDQLFKDGDKGLAFDDTNLQQNFNLYREELSKPGTQSTDQLLTMLSDSIIPGVDLREGNEGIIAGLQSKNDEERLKAKQEAVDYLFGTKENPKSLLYNTAKTVYEGRKDLYDTKQEEAAKKAAAKAAASGGKSKETEAAYKDRKSYEGIKALGNRVVENTLEGTSSSYYSRLKALEQKGSIGKPDENNPHYKEMKNLENDLRKVIGGVQGENLVLSYDVFGNGKYEISNTSAGEGSYTLEQLFSQDDTNPSNLLWAFNRN